MAWPPVSLPIEPPLYWCGRPVGGHLTAEARSADRLEAVPWCPVDRRPPCLRHLRPARLPHQETDQLHRTGFRYARVPLIRFVVDTLQIEPVEVETLSVNRYTSHIWYISQCVISLQTLIA